MDLFDRFLFDEITHDYNQDDLSSEDYEEIYQRFLNLQHVPEVKAYLLAMRFLGFGTKEDEDSVLEELKEHLDDDDIALNGLYYDCILYKNRNDAEAANKLSKFIEKGYSDIYLKEYSHINYDEEDEWEYTITCGNCGNEFVISEEDNSQESVVCPSCKKIIYLDELEDVDNDDDDDDEYDDIDEEDYEDGDIDFVKMAFVSNGISGVYFTASDVDYLCAEVFFEPVESPCHLSVRSKIVDWDELVSDIIEDEIYLDEGDYAFRTTGWGNDSFTGYSAGWLKWVIEINGYDEYSCEFCILDGKIQEHKLYINHVKLFASKTTGANEEDMKYCTTNFEGKLLEHIYFMAILENEPGISVFVKFSIKVIYLEDDSVVFDECFLQSLDADTYACWQSVGYPVPDYWDKGLYKYIVKVGDSNEFEGNFTIF